MQEVLRAAESAFRSYLGQRDASAVPRLVETVRTLEYDRDRWRFTASFSNDEQYCWIVELRRPARHVTDELRETREHYDRVAPALHELYISVVDLHIAQCRVRECHRLSYSRFLAPAPEGIAVQQAHRAMRAAVVAQLNDCRDYGRPVLIEHTPGEAITVETIRAAQRMMQQNNIERRNVQLAQQQCNHFYSEALEELLRQSWAELRVPVRTEAAREKGLDLLKVWLSPRQLKQYNKHQFFDVRGSDTGKWYRIKHGLQQNVFALGYSWGSISHGLCFAPDGYLVEGDVMLAQKIALETDERNTLAVANRFETSVYV